MLGRRRLHLALLASVAALGALGLVTAVSARNGSDELSVTVRNVNNREIGR